MTAALKLLMVCGSLFILGIGGVLTADHAAPARVSVNSLAVGSVA